MNAMKKLVSTVLAMVCGIGYCVPVMLKFYYNNSTIAY